MSLKRWFLTGTTVALVVVMLSVAGMLRWKPRWLFEVSPTVSTVMTIVGANARFGAGDRSREKGLAVVDAAVERLNRFDADRLEDGLANAIASARLSQLATIERVLRARRGDPGWNGLPRVRNALRARMGDRDPKVRRMARLIYAKYSITGASLRWLHDQQEPDGGWPEPERPIAPGYTPGRVGVASLVMLSFLGAGYDHMTPNAHRPCVQAIIRLLIARQQPSGLFAADPNDHALATCAICEAWAMTGDPAIKVPAQRAISQIPPASVDSTGSPEGVVRCALAITALRSAQAGTLDATGLESYRRAWSIAWPVLEEVPPSLLAGCSDGSIACAVHALRFVHLDDNKARSNALARVIISDPPVLSRWPPFASWLGFSVVADPSDSKWTSWLSVLEELEDGCRLGDPATDGSWDAPGGTGERIMLTVQRVLLLDVRNRYLMVSGLP